MRRKPEPFVEPGRCFPPTRVEIRGYAWPLAQAGDVVIVDGIAARIDSVERDRWHTGYWFCAEGEVLP
jgi:hypothetical protein